MDTISVIIPCYNGSEFLAEAIDSALAQTHVPHEVIVIDDGSTDDSADIAASYGAPVRVISQANQGESVARNRGLDEATGSWVAFLDADDIWKPEKLERQLAAAANSTSDQVVAVHTNIFVFGEFEDVSCFEGVDEETRYQPRHLAQRNVFRTPSAMLVRRDCSPRFPTWTTHAEDLIYCLDLVRRGRVELIVDPLTGHRQHSANQTKSAAAQIGWHQTIRTWLKNNEDELSTEDQRAIDECWLKKVASVAWHFKSKRQWQEFWKVRDYLVDFQGQPDVDRVLANRIYPPWLYKGWDLMRRAVRGSQKNRLQPSKRGSHVSRT